MLTKTRNKKQVKLIDDVITMPITDAFDKHLRIKINDKNFE